MVVPVTYGDRNRTINKPHGAMDQPDFTSRFQLLDRVADGPIETYQALADTGVVVMAHFIPRDLPELGGFLERVRSLPRAPEGKILEITAHEGRPVVVTKFILDFESLPAWLDGEAAGSGSAPAGEPTPAIRSDDPAAPPEIEDGPASLPREEPENDPEDEPGEFTRMFKALDPDAGSEAPSAGATTGSASTGDDSAESPAAEDEPAPRPSRDEPGEFTQMFKLSDLQGEGDDTSARPDSGSAQRPSPEDSPTRDQPPAPPVQPRDDRQAGSESGTSRNRPAPPPPPPPPSFGGDRQSDDAGTTDRPEASPADGPASDGSDGPGSFTQEIRRQQPGDSRPLGDRKGQDDPGPPRRPNLGGDPPPKPRSESDDHDTTPSFRGAPPPPPPPGRGSSGSGRPPPGGAGDWRDRLLDADDGSSREDSGSTAPRPDLPRQDGPSDFTRVIKGMRRPDEMGPGGSRPPSPPSAPSSDKFQPPPSSKPIWPLVVGILLVLMVAVGLVVAFWLVGGSGTEAPVPQ